MKKPDRFERMVEEAASGKGDRTFLYQTDAVKLLRREHTWMVRQLKQLSRIKFQDGPFKSGIDTIIEEMEYRLNQRRK